MITCRAVISLRVRVPVLSEQMTVTEPRVSTAGSLRVMALRRTICCTPNARVMVMMAGRPSGMAATAKPMAAIISSVGAKLWTNQPMPSIPTAMMRMITARTRPKAVIWRVSGVSRVSISVIRRVIRPSSVRAPVAVTTPVPMPAATRVPE